MKNLHLYWLLAIFSMSCSSREKTTSESKESVRTDIVALTEAQFKNAGIEIDTPRFANVQTQLKVNGVVDVPPQNIVSISFPLGGYLRSTKLLPGMHVTRGEVIATIEDQSLIQLQQDYLVANARLTYLQQEYERQKSLNENKVNADKVYQQAVSDYTTQKILLKGYHEKLRLIGIDPGKLSEATISRSVPVHSPINGFVSKVNVNIGKYVTGTDVLFELINPEDIHAALTIFEKDIPKVKIGQKVIVSFVDDPTKAYECKVILVTRNVSEDRSALIHCHFETQPANLLPGMFLNATIDVSNVNALIVPEEAVVRFGNKQYVYESLGNNEFKMLEVQTGVAGKDSWEIISNSEDIAKKRLAVKNAYAILSKMKNTAEE